MSDTSITVCLRLYYTLKNPTKSVGLVQSGHHYHLIECSFFLPWYGWKIAHLVL